MQRARGPKRIFGRQNGQALVEWTLVMPIFLLFSVACFQFTVIWWSYISMSNVVRDGTRWLAVHPHTTDAAFTTLMNNRLPSNLSAASLRLTPAPACASLTSGVCTGRTTGSQLSVTATYNISSATVNGVPGANIIFLPTQFGWDPWKIAIPTSLPPITMFMPVEPV